MRCIKKVAHRLLLPAILSFFSLLVQAQNTQIRGFADASVIYDKKLSFGFGEQDLFITSDINDRLSFLGESVFKYTPSTPTEFSVSIERIVIKYNITGNHNFLIGKHHTPLNYWNDTYHHGRVFFPTIDRPLLFSTDIFPLHTTGASLQGLNLGDLKFGYDLMVGNGLGSGEVEDNDKSKSLTLALHLKPTDALQLGLSYYHDVISKGAELHDNSIINYKTNVNFVTASVANFGKKFELLAESMLSVTHTDTTGSKKSLLSYLYAGYKATDKIIPYIRYDDLRYQKGELAFHKDNTTAILAGLRYQVNYLAVVKLEFQHQHSEVAGTSNKVSAQFAIGF